MNGHFGENGELLFDVDLIAVNEEIVSVLEIMELVVNKQKDILTLNLLK